MSLRLAAGLAVWTVSWALAAAAVALRIAFDLPGDPLPGVFLSRAPVEVRAGFAVIGVVVALVYGPVSALIIARRPHPVALVLTVHAIGSGLTAFGVQWGLLGAQHAELPLWGLGAYAAGWGYVPGTFLTAVLPIMVTSARLSRGERALVATGATAAVLAVAASLVQQSAPGPPLNPFAIDALQPVLPGVYTVLSFVAVALSIVSCGVLVRRRRTARGRRRTGLGWLVLGHALLTATYAVLVIPDGVAVPGPVVEIGVIGPVLGQAIYPAALLVVVLGQRLWGVELVVDRIVLWTLLTLGGAAVYLTVVAAAPRLLSAAVPDAARWADGMWIVVPLTVALAVSPLRRWLQRRIDLLVYGEGADTAAVLARLGARIGELEPGEAGVRSLCSALRRVLRLGYVGVRSARLTVETGQAPRHPLVLALQTGDGGHVGDLVVSAPPGQRLDARTVRVLSAASGLVAAAVRLAEENLVLDAARTDLMARRAAERRRIQRELHDGLGPALAGIGFGLAAVGNLLPTRPDAAGELLRELSDDLGRRVRSVRSLASEVSASPLDGMTLDAALAALAERFTTPSLTVDVHLSAIGGLPDAVRDAAYFIVAEAMSNAARHSGARRIAARVLRDGPVIVAEGADDGGGIAPTLRRGIGLASMRERAEALGGTLDIEGSTVDGSARGTRLRARLPAESGHSALHGRDAGTGTVEAWQDRNEES